MPATVSKLEEETDEGSRFGNGISEGTLVLTIVAGVSAVVRYSIDIADKLMTWKKTPPEDEVGIVIQAEGREVQVTIDAVTSRDYLAQKIYRTAVR